MTVEDIIKIISKGEGIHTEFKEARNGLPANVFETITAFLNRNGGDLFLGVSDAGVPVGLNPDRIQKMMNELVTLSNNPNKLDPPSLLFPQEVEIRGKKIIYVRVPQSSQVHKTANVIYDRTMDGDFKVKTHEAISRIYARKSTHFTENKVYPYLHFSDFNQNLFPKVKNLIQSHRLDHPWLGLSNEDLLKSAGLYKRDFETGKEGYTLAAALLFGADEVIQQILPYYKTDALVKRSNLDRYDDRRDIRTNLINAYDELMLFIRSHLPDKFFMERDVRVDLREKIFREVMSNIIIHRDYTNAYATTVIIYNDRLVAENPSNPVTMGHLTLDNFLPYQKNPVISKFFLQLGRVEEIGTGIRNIFKYLRYYSPGMAPEFIEGDIFSTIIPLTSPQSDTANRVRDVVEYKYDTVKSGNDTIKSNYDAVKLQEVARIIDELFEDEIIEKIKERLITEVSYILFHGGITLRQIKKLTGVETATAKRDMKLLANKNLIKFSGAPKTGKYMLTRFGKKIFSDLKGF